MQLPTSSRAVQVVSALGSLVLLFFKSEHRPPVLTALFVVWILAPYALLAIVRALSKYSLRLSASVVDVTAIAVGLGSLAAYGADAIWPRKAQQAFIYVITPPACVVPAGIVLFLAVWTSARRSRSRM